MDDVAIVASVKMMNCQVENELRQKKKADCDDAHELNQRIECDVAYQ